MKCELLYPDLIDAARAGIRPPADAQRHLESCADCREFLETQFALQRALGQSAAEPFPEPLPETMDLAQVDRPMPGPSMETRLLAEFDSAHARPQRWDWPWAAGAAVAASLAVSVALVHQSPAPPKTADRPFLEIPYTAPLAPYERTRIVRMDVPVAALIAAGFEVHAPDAGAALRADVIFGQDGRAHAIRLVSDSDSDRRNN